MRTLKRRSDCDLMDAKFARDVYVADFRGTAAAAIYDPWGVSRRVEMRPDGARMWSGHRARAVAIVNGTWTAMGLIGGSGA